jgi:hypothetical protein
VLCFGSVVVAFALFSTQTAHLQACTSVTQCPHFPDLFLTVGDWSFMVWQESVFDSGPVYTSPPVSAEHQLVVARWSPTRAGVIISALSSGYVEMYVRVRRCGDACN